MKQKPETVVEAVAVRPDDKAERLKRAAMPCPEEFRPAFAHVLGGLLALSDFEFEDGDFRTQASWAAAVFRRSILTLILDYPEIEPWELAELADTIAETIPGLDEFPEQLRMLSRLRSRKFD